MVRKNKKVYSRRSKSLNKNSKIWLILGLVSLLIIVGVVFGLRNKDNSGAASESTSSNSTSDNSDDQSSSNGDQPSSSSSSSSSDKSASSAGSGSSGTTSSSAPLKTPYGTFISNDTPGQNGAPMTIDSVCITTAGAKCYIKFTKGSTTKQLETKQANGDGYVEWSQWKPSDIGLTSGSWKVTAVATNGTNTLTADYGTLEVQ